MRTPVPLLGRQAGDLGPKAGPLAGVEGPPRQRAPRSHTTGDDSVGRELIHRGSRAARRYQKGNALKSIKDTAMKSDHAATELEVRAAEALKALLEQVSAVKLER